MIEVKNISKEFIKELSKNKKEKFLADNNISFKVKKGEVLGLLGPNGAGKTTLLRILAGIMTPTEGEISIDNMNYKNNSLEIKQQLAFLSGNTKLYKDISANELLTMCCEYYNVPKKEINKRIEKVSEEFDIKDFINQKLSNLSTGQLQRVNIARCAVHNPNIYIFDEATSGLDIISSKVILDFIKSEKKKNKTIIYSTHYMEEAENICDKVVLLHKGKVVDYGTPQEIITKTNTTNLRDAFFKIIGGEHE